MALGQVLSFEECLSTFCSKIRYHKSDESKEQEQELENQKSSG